MDFLHTKFDVFIGNSTMYIYIYIYTHIQSNKTPKNKTDNFAIIFSFRILLFHLFLGDVKKTTSPNHAEKIPTFPVDLGNGQVWASFLPSPNL